MLFFIELFMLEKLNLDLSILDYDYGGGRGGEDLSCM